MKSLVISQHFFNNFLKFGREIWKI